MASAKGVRSAYWLGIDLGGTNIKAGVVDDEGRPLGRASIPTEPQHGGEKGVRQISEAAGIALSEAGLALDDVAAIGIGSPGPMDLKQQVLINPHNLPGWWNMPLANMVGEALGKRAVLQNDANAAAFGEYWVGAGKGCRSMVQFTLGTGVGCGIVIGGRILEGEHSHGGESGHLRIALVHPRRNGTGLYGSLEAYASATAVVERTEEALALGQPSVLGEDKRGTLTSKRIFDAAAAGDELAGRIVEETAFYLAIGAVNLMHTIDPDMVVYSGGMIAAGEGFLERIREHVRQNALPVPAEKTEVLFAKLGADAGFIGAAGCARTKFGTSR